MYQGFLNTELVVARELKLSEMTLQGRGVSKGPPNISPGFSDVYEQRAFSAITVTSKIILASTSH